MNPFTEKIIDFAIKLLEYAITLPHGSSLAVLLAGVAKSLIEYAISRDPPPVFGSRLAQLTKDVEARTADLGGALSGLPK